MIVVLVVLAACGSKANAPTPTCRVAHLSPRYLPSGLHPAKAEPFVQSGWTKTWTDGARTVQVAGDVSANLGDGADIKNATVRGAAAQYGATGLPAGPLTVMWSEGTSCSKQYAVTVKGITATEMLRIANSLR